MKIEVLIFTLIICFDNSLIYANLPIYSYSTNEMMNFIYPCPQFPSKKKKKFQIYIKNNFSLFPINGQIIFDYKSFKIFNK